MRDVLKLGLALTILLAPSLAHAGAACKPLSLYTTMKTVGDPTNSPLIPVTMSGKKTLMLIDTGAFTSFVFEPVVRELGLTQMEASVRAISVSGRSASKMVRIPELLFGRMTARDQLFMVSPNDDPSAVIGENDVAGLLGADVLQNYDVDFDFVGRSFTLFSQDHCPGQVLYWKPQAVAIVPFRLEDQSHINFPVMVNGSRVIAMLDTGFSNTTINQRAARRIFGFDTNAANVEQVGELVGERGQIAPIYRTRIEKIEIEGITISNPIVQIMPDMMGRSSAVTPIGSIIPRSDANLPDVILGMSVLSKLHLYIAYKERKLYISSPFAPAAPATPQ